MAREITAHEWLLLELADRPEGIGLGEIRERGIDPLEAMLEGGVGIESEIGVECFTAPRSIYLDPYGAHLVARLLAENP